MRSAIPAISSGIHRQHQELAVNARSTVEVAPEPRLPDRLDDSSWEQLAAWRDMPEYWDYTRPSRFARPSPALAEFAAQHNITAPAMDPLTSLLGLSRTLFGAFRFAAGNTSATSPIEHILKTGQGVCQDYSHVMIVVAREWGVPARYVSGYLYDADPNGQSLSASAMHAWVECRLPDIGWVGFDPTNDRLAGSDHVRGRGRARLS